MRKIICLLVFFSFAPSVHGASYSAGNIGIATSEYYLNVSIGVIPFAINLHKFGNASDIDIADGFVDIWDGAGYDNSMKTYTYSSSADIDSLSSDNAGDTQIILVIGLDTNWETVIQQVTLNGQSRVALTTSLIRVFFMRNSGSTDLAGNVFLYVNGAITSGEPDDLSDVRALITIGNNRTLSAIFSIPANADAYWLDFYASMSKKQAANSVVKIRTREFGGVFVVRHINTISSTGTSKEYQPLKAPIRLPPKTDFMISANTSADNTGVSAGGDFIFIAQNPATETLLRAMANEN